MGVITFCLLRMKSHGGSKFLFTVDEVTWGPMHDKSMM